VNDREESDRAPAPSPADLADQLRAAADRLVAGWSRAATGGVPRPPAPTLPAALSARQVQAVLDDIGARRAQVRALLTQLEAFDEQLGTLEESLRPVLDWTRSWADVEKAVSEFWRLGPPR
jgi:hypothetical protein